MTDRQASMWSVFSMSKTNWGFFKMFTQKRRGRLWGRDSGGAGAQWGAWEVDMLTLPAPAASGHLTLPLPATDNPHPKEPPSPSSQARLLVLIRSPHPVACVQTPPPLGLARRRQG